MLSPAEPCTRPRTHSCASINRSVGAEISGIAGCPGMSSPRVTCLRETFEIRLSQGLPAIKRAAEPEDSAAVVKESASQGLCGSPRPPQPAPEKLPQSVAPVLRFPCSVGSIGGSDFHPGRFCFSSHVSPSFSSPHAMGAKSGGHPKKAGDTHEGATPRR